MYSHYTLKRCDCGQALKSEKFHYLPILCPYHHLLPRPIDLVLPTGGVAFPRVVGLLCSVKRPFLRLHVEPAPLEVEVCVSPCTSHYFCHQDGGVLRSFAHRWPRGQLCSWSCGLLVAHQVPWMPSPWLWSWNPDKKDGKDNDRGLCVVCFISLSLLVFVPFAACGHAGPGPLF